MYIMLDSVLNHLLNVCVLLKSKKQGERAYLHFLPSC